MYGSNNQQQNTFKNKTPSRVSLSSSSYRTGPFLYYIGITPPENLQKYLQTDVDNDKIANFTDKPIKYNTMMEEKYVYVIHYFSMRLDTGEIKDKIWLEGNHYYAKQFFNIRKDMIDRAVGKKPRIVEFERRGYYNVEVEAPGNGFDGLTTIIYTLTMQRKKVRFYELKDLAGSFKDSAL